MKIETPNDCQVSFTVDGEYHHQQTRSDIYIIALETGVEA